VASAQAELSQIAQQLAKEHPRTNRGIGVAVLPLWQGHQGAQTLLLAPLRILSVVCCVVMLIVCFNLTNMLLARATARQNEFSVRTALGASRWRVGRQVLTEVLLLTLLGAFAGVVVAVFTGPTLTYLFPPTEFPISLNIEPNGEVIAFAVLLCVVVAMVAAIVPVWHATDSNINEKLKEGGRTQGSSRSAGRVRTALVVAEVALAFVALIGAGLFAKSFRAISRSSPGFNPEGVTIARFHLSGNGYDVAARKQFFRELRRRVESAPGATTVSYSDVAPMGLDAGWWEDTGIEGYVPQPGENMKLFRSVVAPGYFRVMEIPLLEGRDFTDLDDEHSEPVAIVNQEFVRKFIPTGNPIGHHLHGWGRDFRIVGVAQDSKYLQLTEAPRPFYYVPFQQIFRGDMEMSFYVRSRASTAETLATLRQQVRGIDPAVQVQDAMPMTEYLAASLYPQKIAAVLLTVLGGLAVLLAGVGLFSVLAYVVTQRAHEIGIRMALGARPQDVLTDVVRHALVMTAGGVVAGLVLAIAATPMLKRLSLEGSQLLQGSATDPLVYAACAGFLVVVALLASSLPARRAAQVDPMISLRYE
ncbi:MAG TPA: FtsX-like permease family protein, partial [Terriglobales bacterium]|nr:FtsX-like permease family protein [Terriglobales bacterium]